MKRSILIFLICALAFILAVLPACSDNHDTPGSPMLANDPEVLAKWDEYDRLDGIPRFTFNGVFENIYENNEMTVVSFLGVSQNDFEAYTQVLTSDGFRLRDDSSIWITEGMSGVPVFEKGSITLTLVWSMNGSLDISAE